MGGAWSYATRTGNTGNAYPVNTSDPTPLSRRWVYAWTFLTWLISFSFAIFTIVAFKNPLPSTDSVWRMRADRFLQTLPCLQKEQWSDLGGVRTIYSNPTSLTTAYTTGASDIILSAVMRKMRCHGGMPNGTATPLTGGISGATASSEMASWFEFSAPGCSCIWDKHKTVYQPLYITKTTAAGVQALGTDFTNVGFAANVVPGMAAGKVVSSLVSDCFMPLQKNRMPRVLKQMEACVLEVSPYAVAMYCNSIAGMFGAMYLMHRQSSDTVLSSLKIAGMSLFVLLNAGVGIAVLVVSQQAEGMVFTIIFQGIGTILVGLGLAYMSMLGSGHLESLGLKSLDTENMHVVQRSMFWLQYVLTMPAIVVLYDSLLQQRMIEYLQVRLLLAISVALLAAGYDMLSIFCEKLAVSTSEQAKHQKDTAMVNNLRDATYWCWLCWVLSVLILVYTSPPIAISWSFVELVPGASSMIPVVFALYVVGMPFVCMPNGVLGFNKTNRDTGADHIDDIDSDTLGVRLALEFAARLVLTLTVYFWLAEPQVPLPL